MYYVVQYDTGEIVWTTADASRARVQRLVDLRTGAKVLELASYPEALALLRERRVWHGSGGKFAIADLFGKGNVVVEADLRDTSNQS